MLVQFLYRNQFLRFQHLWCTLAALIPAVAEPPELSRLKCAGHHHKGNIDSNTHETEQFLVCRVTSRYNHRYSDRTSIPRTKASPEILQPYIFYNTGIVFISRSLKHYYRSKLSKALYKTILLVQTPRVSQPSPLKGISPRDYRKKRNGKV